MDGLASKAFPMTCPDKKPNNCFLTIAIWLLNCSGKFAARLHQVIGASMAPYRDLLKTLLQMTASCNQRLHHSNAFTTPAAIC